MTQTNNESIEDNLFTMLREEIIQRSQKNIYMHSGTENLINLPPSRYGSIQTVFRKDADPTVVEIKAHYADHSFASFEYSNIANHFYFVPDPSKRITHITVRRKTNTWSAWKYFNYQLKLFENVNPNPNDQPCWLYHSMENISTLDATIAKTRGVTLNDEQCDFLESLLQTALFEKDWRNKTTIIASLYQDITLALHPYTISAHGYTLPLSSQGKAAIESKLPVIATHLDKFSNDWFATSGTLLGIVRDGSLIEWDDDLDFAIYLGVIDDEESLHSKVQDIYNNNSDILNTGINPLHFKLRAIGAAVDIFIAWSDSSNRFYVYPWCDGQLETADFLPTVRSFQGVNIPNQPQKALTLNYGYNWKVPDPMWRFDWKSSNIRFKKQLIYLKKHFAD